MSVLRDDRQECLSYYPTSFEFRHTFPYIVPSRRHPSKSTGEYHMFRKIALWLLLLEIVGSMVLFAQQDEEEPLPPPRRTSAPKIGGALGFTQNVLFLNLDPINEVLRKSNAAPFSGNAMLLTGAQ